MLETILYTLLSLIVLFILTKLMGYRQVTQLNMYDYIIGITIGSISAEVVLSQGVEVLKPIVGMIIYALFTICLSLLSKRSVKLRSLIEGDPYLLYAHDHFYIEAMNKARIDINEFLMSLRNLGYFDLTQIERVSMEVNGKLSVYVKSPYRPSQLSDLNKKQEEHPLDILIIDGHLFDDILNLHHQDKEWLSSILSTMGYPYIQEIYLALIDFDNNITVYKKSA